MISTKTYYSFGIVLLLCLFLTSACGELSQGNKRKVNQALSDSLTSTTQTTNLTLNLIENGLKKVQLHGTSAQTFNTDSLNETRISGPVSIMVYDSTQTVKTWVKADSAIYYSENSKFKLFGNVVVRTRSKKYLYSEYLYWNQSDNKISTPRLVTIITPTDSIAGTGFTGTTDLSHYTIKNPTGQISL